MTIKKHAATGGGAAPAAGGATIADRFKLDAPPPKKAAVGGKFLTCTFIAAIIALGVAGILTYIIWKHWEFLMPA